MSIHWLPYLHTLHFCIVSERLFTQLTFPVMQGKPGADFITNASRNATRTEISPLVILVMDGVDERKAGNDANLFI